MTDERTPTSIEKAEAVIHAMTQNKGPLWIYEHGLDYAVPESIAFDAELEDTSWHNDVCPSFWVSGTTGEGLHYRLWINHPDADRREFDDAHRFMVMSHGGDSDDGNMLYEGDDATIAVRVLKIATIQAQVRALAVELNHPNGDRDDFSAQLLDTAPIDMTDADLACLHEGLDHLTLMAFVQTEQKKGKS